MLGSYSYPFRPISAPRVLEGTCLSAMRGVEAGEKLRARAEFGLAEFVERRVDGFEKFVHVAVLHSVTTCT